MSRTGVIVPRWVAPAAMLLTLAGLGVSAYLTAAHFDTSVVLSCPANSTINCEKVTTSPESWVFGIPVAVLGLIYYVGMVVVQWPRLWRSGAPVVRLGRIGYMVAGIGFVVYLVYAEFAEIGAICLWCTAVHVITFLLLCVTLFGTALSFEALPDDDDAGGELTVQGGSHASE